MEHVTPKQTLGLVCIGLLVLTFLTYAAALTNLGVWHTPVALGIASLKAMLIIFFFMNARFSTGITRIVIGGGLLWLGLLVAGTMDDLITRGWLGVSGK